MMKKNLLTLFFLIGLIGLKAQSIITLGSGLDTSGTTDSSPINIYYKSHHCQILYKASELNTAGWTGQGIISKLGFNIYGTTSEGLPNFSIKLKNISTSTVDVYDGNAMTTVYSSALYSPVAGGFELLNLGSSFIWDGTSNLLVDVCFDQVGTYTGTGRVYTYTYTNTGSEYEYIRDDSAPQCGVATTQAMSISKPQLQLELTTPPACSGMPMTDAATSSSTLTCPNTSFYLGLTNPVLNSGFVYQWQSSLDGSLWNNMGSQQTGTSYSISSITDTTYYRCLTTCTVSAQTNTSIPIVVNFNPLINCYCLPNYSWTCTNDNFTDFSLSNIVSQPTACDPSGYADSTSSNYTIINLNAANTYTLLTNATVSGFYGDAAMGAWIDYNQNSIFEPTEFTSLGFGPSGTYSNTLTVPLTSPSGLVRMRLKLDEYYASSGTVLDPCINNNGTYNGQTLDFKVNITAAPACSGVPNAGDATSTETTVCQNKSFSLDLVNNSIASSISYQWQSSTDNTIWTNMGTAQSTIPYSITTQSISTYYRCITTCSISSMSSTSTPIMVAQNLPTACYCVTEPMDCTNAYFSTVNFETLSDNPICNTAPPNAGYIFNTTNTITINANQTYTISNTINTQGTSYLGVWIDYNQDGFFDANEYSALGGGPAGTYTGNIVVPFTAVGGNTRMRLKLEELFTAPTTLVPCIGIQGNGQTLDYPINIIPASPCSGSPNAGDANSTVSSVCENTPFTLDLINNDIVSNISYQWQSSPDNVIWTNIGSSQSYVPYTISSQSITTHYRCLTTCTTSALTSTSTPWAVIQNPVTTCYCVPEPSDCMGGDEINYVAFATITNTSACDGTNGYSDYTGSVSSATINAGQSYTLTTRLGYMFGEHVYVWIDYDQNGIFDPSEYTDLGSNSGNDTIKNPINIPASALTGNTRMRVRNYSGMGLGPNDACVSPSGGAKLLMPIMGYGETEDYMVTILPPDCSIINFPPTIPLSGNLDICPGSSTTLDLTTALPVATGITYQWKYYNGTAYVNAGAANSSSSFTDAPTVNTSYFCEILCNGNPVHNTDTVFVKVQTITTAPTSSSVTCNGLCDGTATMNASSFGSTLTYSWSPSGPTSDMGIALCAGSYTVNISNPTGCIVTETLTIVEPTPIIISSPTQTNVSCFGLTDGAAAVTVSGGTSPLTFSWSPTGGSALTASNLAAGNYTFMIFDGNSCNKTSTFTIIEPTPLTVSVTNVVGTCFGGSGGQAEMIVSGGTASYNYSWTSGGSNQLETGLSIGTQTCTITDANSCTITETVSIAQTSSNFSLSISGVSSICEQLEDSVTSTITGGSGSFSYSWLELPTNATSVNPNFTYTASVGSYSYNLTVTDNISNCVVNSNTVALVVNPSSNFSGTVTTSGGVPVAGSVVLYKYLPFYTRFDSVAGQNIGASGDFLFNSFASGTYIIKAIPTATNMQIAYGANPGDTATAWKDAKQINHGCAVNDIQNIFVPAMITFTTSGSGSLSGTIYEDFGFEPKGFGAKPTIPGTPIGGIIVKGGKNPGGQMFAQTITPGPLDPAWGTYTLSGLPANGPGESYFIVVDIPGLDTNQTYHRVITITDNNFSGLDFYVDSAKVNPVPSSVISVHDISAIENDIKVFPNPASNYVSIHYNLKNSSLVKIELFDMLGKSVKMIMPETQQGMEMYKKSWQIDDVRSGLYFIKMTINGAESTIKLSVTN